MHVPVTARLESDDFDCENVRVRELKGREAVSELFHFVLTVVLQGDKGLDVDAILAAGVRIVFERDGEELRRVHGMIAEVVDLLDTRERFRSYELRIVPRAYRLAMIETQEIFLDLGLADVLKKKLDLVGLAVGPDVDLRLEDAYEPRELVVQYKESDAAFLARLTEQLGVTFFFDHAGGADKLVFTDHPTGFPSLAPVRFDDHGDRLDIYALRSTTRVVPASYVVRDYNYRNPLVDLLASAEVKHGYAGGVVEYGTHVKTPEEAQRLAKIRAEEVAAWRSVLRGESARPEIAAGYVLPIEGHARLEHAELLVTSVEHALVQAVDGDGDAQETRYANVFEGISTRLPFRPARKTPLPRIYGLVSGVVEPSPDQAQGRFARLDEHGRYTVKFHFDGAEGDRLFSKRVRMAQNHAGPGYGTHFPLKPGAEVLLAFIDGDPDRPIIVAAVPNAVTPSPVTGQNATANVMKTVTGILFEMNDGGR